MSDFNSSLPVRTQNNGDIVVEVSDGTTPSQKMAVNSAGSAQVAGQGVAGTPAGGVVSVQGVTGGTALPISGTVTATNPSVSTNGAAGPSSSTQSGGLVATSSPSYTTGNLEPLSLTLAGALRVDGSSVTQPVSGTVAVTQSTTPWVDNISQIGGSAISLGQTTMSASIPVAIASNQSAVASNITQIGGSTQSATNPLFVELTNGTSAISSANPLPVSSTPVVVGTPKLYYTDSAAVAVGSPATQSITAAGTSGFYLQSIVLSGSGKFKATVAIGATTYFAAFNSTATPTVEIAIPNNFLVPTGTAIVVTMTNNDLAAQDLYSTLVGIQI